MLTYILSKTFTNVDVMGFKIGWLTWEQRKLGEMVKFSKGKGYSKSDLSNKGFPIILYGRMYTNYETEINNVDTFVQKQKNDSLISNGGEVIVPASGETAEDISVASVVRRPGVIIGGDLNILYANRFINPIFLALAITYGNAHRKMAQRAQGKSIVHLHNSDLANIKLIFPSIDEQSLISNFLKKVDKAITLQQRKLDQLNTLKKGLLQKMFADKKHPQPELRFKGFSGDWEQHKLEDLGSVQMNKRIFKDQTSESGEVPFFKIGTFGKKPDSFISKKLFNEYKSKYPYPEVGDILISASGSIGRTVVYNGEDAYFQDSNIVWLEHDSRLKNSFLEQFLKRTKWNKIEGSTIKRLYNKDILNKKINLPDQQEQSTIGNFFKQLDSLITLQQKQIDKLNSLKKSLLQNMFI